jgi:DNA helicase-2/ATP-dependent DNA helicase PcrA
LNNQRILGGPIVEALETENVNCEHPREEGFLHTEAGRLAFALLRVSCEPDDYVSHRAIVGLRNRIGIARCDQVFQAVITANLNFRSIFYDPIPPGSITGHALTTVNHARATCAAINGWQGEDRLDQRRAAISAIIQGALTDAVGWEEFADTVPQGITLEELCDFMWADTDEQQATVLHAVYVRLEIPIPEQGVLQPRVRIMTMHGAKGLSGRVVFIPGLEDQIFPGPWRHQFPGLVLEAARLLYVSITRARACCVMSYSTRRMVNGQMCEHTASRFAAHLGGAFVYRTQGALEPGELTQIMTDCGNL